MTPAGFSPDGSRVVTFGSDGSARIWSTGAVKPQPAHTGPGMPSALRALGGLANIVPSATGLGPDPLAPVAAFFSGSGVSVIDARTGAHLTELPSGFVAFDPAGRVAFLMRDNRAAQIYAVRTGRLLHTLSGFGSVGVSNGAVSPDGKLVAGADNKDRIGVWDVATGRHLTSFYRHHPQPGFGADVTLKFSPDGSLLLSADQSGLTYVWNARTGQVLNRIVGPRPPQGMYNESMGGAISPDDKLVVTTSGWDNNAHVFQVGKPSELITLRGHSDGIYDASFSPDSSLIATTAVPGGLGGNCEGTFTTAVCDDSTRVWDIQQSAPLLTLTGDGATRVDFSPDGSSLVVNSSLPYATLSCIVCGGFSRIVPLAIHAEVQQPTAQQRARFHIS